MSGHMDKPKKSWKDRLVPVVRTLQPVTRVIERASQVAVHLQKPTIVGIASVMGTALSAIAESLSNGHPAGTTLPMLLSKGQLISAIEGAGAKVLVKQHGDGSQTITAKIGPTEFYITPSGAVYMTTEPTPEFLEWMRQSIDRTLTPAIEIRQRREERKETFEARALNLSQFENDQADEIMRASVPLIEGGRCILLDGKPGVGKTTMAQIIARKAGLGRTVMLDSTVAGMDIEEFGHLSSSNDLRDGLSFLSPGVIIIDDIDKVHVPLGHLEALRSAAKLVILTANNGQYDEVLDGALMRAGRVDEVFTIRPAKLAREAPYDQLTDDEWSEVNQWPVAYLIEVKKRLLNRPDYLRLDDLRQRLTRKTRSGDVLK